MFGLTIPAIPFLPFLSRSRAEPAVAEPIVLDRDQIDEIGRELDALRERTVASLGAEDRDYIYRIIKAQRGFEVAGRGLLFLGFFPPAWVAGVAALSVSKILDNMEIGHNVMHGQYDWMREPSLNSRTFEWDTVCPSDQWRHSHNYMHHTYTNIVGKDRDIGYGILRMDPAQKWHPYYLGNPLYATALMLLFEWGVMLHDAEVERLVSRERNWRDVIPLAKGWWRKVRRQVVKDYIAFPLLSGPMFVPTLVGNATANLVRNLWTFSIIFCGHFPSGVQSFSKEETANETRGEWYVRQMLGSANITGTPLFHIMSGNLSHQIEHHLFPDLPAHRYPELAPQVQALCEKHGLPYNTGGLFAQVSSVWRKIFRFALPPSLVSPEPETTVFLDRAPSSERGIETAGTLARDNA
ncbi:acyl-CoA desaturase [Rhodococcus sp. HNM0563]|uniref:fatty acid desaturase family protein n=1 Tax=unclassified Rhodococcus (in: high G+C Gram-positive bacteria) TaxID=192944 RepID=UPI00146C8D43|nr:MULTISPECIES: acyl-CoA desaturase [unclassified Rhodococcus (in: high G+C Gram-positive bacteria)]MCK0092355.1 acyl-CoA desaturase [Rhodococcus sp. F64268]NLU63102.1 acyl-CoA desaturase [Rhodococcus sp. HNM0563]